MLPMINRIPSEILGSGKHCLDRGCFYEAIAVQSRWLLYRRGEGGGVKKQQTVLQIWSPPAGRGQSMLSEFKV